MSFFEQICRKITKLDTTYKETCISDIDVDLQSYKSKTHLSLMDVKWLYIHFRDVNEIPSISMKKKFNLLMKVSSDGTFFTNLLFTEYFKKNNFKVTFEHFFNFITLITKIRLKRPVKPEKDTLLKFVHQLFHQKSLLEQYLHHIKKNKDIKIEKKNFTKNIFTCNNEILKYEKFVEKVKDFIGVIKSGFGLFPHLIGNLTKYFFNSPKNLTGHYKTVIFSLFGYFKQLRKYYYVCKGGMILKYESSKSQVPIEIIQLFGSKIFRIHNTKNHKSMYKILYDQGRKQLVIQITSEQFLRAIMFYSVEENGNKFNGFAPTRYKCNANWVVNGKPFYSRIAEVFESAKSEIFFSCWWISPELYLRRYVNETGKKTSLCDRLDYILKKKASEGVIIYFLLWNHNPWVSRLDCEYVAKTFSKMHPNFKIMLHPMAKLNYGHHQKMIVIDQEVAFQGGLDVCYGRYDDYNHVITDPTHVGATWPGIDYWNPLVRTTHSVRFPFVDYIDRSKTPKMGWHDVSMEVDGLGARDLSKNFIERWNNSRNELINAHSNVSLQLAVEKNTPLLTLNDYNVPSYFNRLRDLKGFKCNNMIVKKERPHITISYENKKDSCGYPKDENLHTCSVQITRNLSPWAGSSGRHDTALYKSHIHYMEKAKHYIFIEQQYFTTDTCGFGVKNKIGSVIVKKIKEALEENRTFRVFICYPLQPDGIFYVDDIVRTIMFYNNHSTFLGETSIYEQVKALCKKKNKHVDDYLMFVCLRQWGKIMDKLVTEQVYPHTKILIVDDEVAIIGSANIGDRGFLQDRDSEISSTIKDDAKLKIKMNGKDFMAAKFAYTLRLYIFNEYMGLPKDDVSLMDPICNKTFNLIQEIARENERILEYVFPYCPGNNLTSWEKCKGKIFECKLNKKISPKRAEEMLKKIRGIVFDFPKRFMETGLWANYSEKTLFLDNSLFQ